MLFRDILINISSCDFVHPRETILCDSSRGHYEESFHKSFLIWNSGSGGEVV